MSSSILTNMAAMTAVQNLAATQKSLAQTQNEISTGLAVSSAQDNAAYYSIAQTMRTSVSNMSAVSSSLNVASSVVSTATAATTNVYSILQSIQSDLTNAASNTSSESTLDTLQTSIDTLRTQLASTVSSASFNGVNLLDGSNKNAVQFVSGIIGSGAGTSVQTLSINTTSTNMTGVNYQTGTDAVANSAVTADAAAADAKSNYNSLMSALSTALGGLKSSDLGGGFGAAVTTSNSTAAFKAMFGSTAVMSTAGAVTSITATSTIGKLLGAGSLNLDATSTTSGKLSSFAPAANSPAASALTAYFGTGATSSSTAVSAANYQTALANFKTAFATLSNTDLGSGSAVTAGSGSAALQAVFGANVAVAASTGVVSGIDANSIAGKLLGATGATVTVNLAGSNPVLSSAAGSSSASSGALNAFTGAASSTLTVGFTSLAGSAYSADTAASTATTSGTYGTYLVDNAVTTQNAKLTALSSYDTAKSNFLSAVNGLSSGTDLANGQSTAAFQNVFGATASIANGVVTGISATSVAGTLLGSGGSYTVSGGTYTTSGTDATTGGALWSLYGTGATDKTTDATATGGASWTATQAANMAKTSSASASTYNSALFSVSQIDLKGATSDQIQSYIKQVGTALTAVNTASETLGSAATNITMQSTYTGILSDSLTNGIGSLVDADMNEASTRLSALQTQQQLGVQALSVANQNSQLILKLFQG